jgi:hypothetical protein
MILRMSEQWFLTFLNIFFLISSWWSLTFHYDYFLTLPNSDAENSPTMMSDISERQFYKWLKNNIQLIWTMIISIFEQWSWTDLSTDLKHFWTMILNIFVQWSGRLLKDHLLEHFIRTILSIGLTNFWQFSWPLLRKVFILYKHLSEALVPQHMLLSVINNLVFLTYLKFSFPLIGSGLENYFTFSSCLV